MVVAAIVVPGLCIAMFRADDFLIGLDVFFWVILLNQVSMGSAVYCFVFFGDSRATISFYSAF